MERRTETRQSIRHYATLNFNNKLLPCLLLNQSSGGALLSLAKKELIPVGATIDLALEIKRGFVRHVKAYTTRQQGDFIGICYCNHTRADKEDLDNVFAL